MWMSVLVNIQHTGAEQNRGFPKVGLVQKGWDNPKHVWFLAPNCSIPYSYREKSEWGDGNKGQVFHWSLEEAAPFPHCISLHLLFLALCPHSPTPVQLPEEMKTKYWGSCDMKGPIFMFLTGTYSKGKNKSKDKIYVIHYALCII